MGDRGVARCFAIDLGRKLKKKIISYKELLWIPSAIPFFLFGVTYYLISPSIALYFFDNNAVIIAAKKYIDLSYFDTRYFADCFLIVVSWLLGYLIAQKIKLNKTVLDRSSNFIIAPTIAASLLLLFMLFTIIKSKLSGTVFFVGYASYDVALLGQSATILFMSVWFINYFQKRTPKFLFIITFLVASFLMLGLGSRMFFVLGTISLILSFLSKNPKILTNPLLYLFLFGLLSFVVWIGIWRSNMELSFEGLVSIFLAEPLFTSTSGSLYIKNMGGRPLTGFPIDVFASFINFIPSFIFPGKLEIINALTYDESKFSPFGASALMVNIYSNFGLFFPIYFFIIGMFFGFLRKMARYSKFYYATYLSLLPLLMFHFFREGFITVFKIMFFNGFVFPAIIIGLSILVFHKNKTFLG